MTCRIFDYILYPFYLIWVVSVFIFSSILCFIPGRLGRMTFPNLGHLVFGKLSMLPFFLKIEKTDTIPAKAIFIANHTSMMDIAVIAASFPNLRFLSKIEVSRVPVLGFVMKQTGHFLVDRKDPSSRKKVIQDILKTPDVDLVLFPEGTRNPMPQKGLLEFRGGAFRLAKDLKLPLVLVYIEGANGIMAKHELVPHFFKRVSVRVVDVIQEPDEKKAFEILNSFNRRIYGI